MAATETNIDRRVILLGPQHGQQNVAQAVDDLEVDGPLATVTAGWAEREAEDAELSEHLGGRTINLALYPRSEEVFNEDPNIRDMLYDRYDRLRRLQTLYRLRLVPQLKTCRDLLSRTDPTEPDALHGPEIDDAIEGIRSLDKHHLARAAALDSEIAHRMAAHERSSIQRQRQNLAEVLDGVDAILIAGGQVGTLLNRLRLFDIFSLAPRKPVVAWSGGAMVVSERLVLFHDSPPQGPGDSEVYAAGLGLARGVVPLPHAIDRLHLDDPDRVALLARRYAPDICVALDGGSRIDNINGGNQWRLRDTSRLLQTDGDVLSAPTGQPVTVGNRSDIGREVTA